MENLTTIKGHNSTFNVRKMMCNNPKLDLFNIYPYTCTRFVKILTFFSQDIEQKRNYDGMTDGGMIDIIPKSSIAAPLFQSGA